MSSQIETLGDADIDAACATCGNIYDKAFKVETSSGDAFVFDSIECMAAIVAPTCDHCGCRILGHGVESSEGMFCCAHCASLSGEDRIVDRA